MRQSEQLSDLFRRVEETAMSTGSGTTTRPFTSGYAPVNGLEMYYEVHGTGRPLVLLHGGLLTIDLSFGTMLPALATTRQVIAAELHGHGRTADTDRDVTIEYMASDVVGLLDHLGIERADLFGFSLGGLVALELAMRRPDRTGQIVIAAVHFRADGYHPEIRNPELHAGSTRMPTERDFQDMRDAYVQVAPDPDHFDEFTAKASAAVGAFQGWPEERLRAVTVPTLLVVGDHDFVRLEHAVEMHELIPDAQLAVLPGATHMDLTRRADLIVPMIESFLPSST
jgi:pimeloyl-ACP methyl ester carboxylesterase